MAQAIVQAGATRRALETPHLARTPTELMSRLPPALLYLAIYNPTLRPTGPVAEDDEDAEEQAHILFYTARERAVSRDRMLRQIGLAKALSNFSEVFSQDEPCENVHSQSRRMIMLQPEPDFWIHACIELAKSPRRVGPPKGKKQAKGKSADKGKDKGKEVELVYDHHDGSIHDLALESQLMRGYEQFKLIHGSLSHILHTLGQQALELQLERFFTVWAWRWDIEQDSEFGSHLGLPLHPHHRALVPLLDNFASLIPSTPDASPFAIIPPYIVPSTSFTSSGNLSALPPYLRTRIPPPRPPSPLVPPLDSITPSASLNTDNAADGAFGANVFLSSMDVRKWGWPGYLTFGKGNGKKTESQESIASAAAEKPPEKEPEEPVVDKAAEPVQDDEHLKVEGISVQVDAESLHDAISSDSVNGLADSAQQDGEPRDRSPADKDDVSTSESVSNVDDRSPAPEQDQSPTEPAVDGGDVDVHAPTTDIPVASPPSAPSPLIQTQTSSTTDAVDSIPPEITYEPPPPEPSSSPSRSPSSSPPAVSSQDHVADPCLPPDFSRLSVYVAPRDEPQATTRRKVQYLVHEQVVLAFLTKETPEYSDDELLTLRHAASECLSDLQNRLQEEEAKGTPETSLPSASKILQPKDKYIIATGHGTTVSSPNFTSRSEHLYNGQQLLSNPDIVEVFSRTQGPQHWYISRREPEGAVFMEVSRKETSLTDVDNELAGVIRRSGDGG